MNKSKFTEAHRSHLRQNARKRVSRGLPQGASRRRRLIDRQVSTTPKIEQRVNYRL